MRPLVPPRLARALTPELWGRANRELIAKLVTELVYEDVLVPERLDHEGASELGARGRFRARLDPHLELAYEATSRSFGAWRVDPVTLRAERDGTPVDELPDAAEVIARGAPTVGATPETTAGLIGEVTATLLSDAVQLAEGRPVAELAGLSGAELDAHLRGHPWIVASKGRIGFDPADVDDYAPESGRTVRLTWLAVRAELASVTTVPELDLGQVVREQVGAEGLAELQARTRAAGLDPAEVVLLPAHPWQLRERLTALHAAELARREIVVLGDPLDREYRPQLSLRTLADAADPTRRDVKLPVSILNTSTYRGLPREDTLAAPALTAWLRERFDADPFLSSRLVLLGEVAAVSVPSRAMELVAGVPYQHTEALGVLYREPVAPRLGQGERAITLAALLHTDPAGASLLAELVDRSGIGADAWIDRLHEVTLPPLLHVLYRYGLTFSPHGQNVLLILDADGVPARIAVKDFADDAIMSADPLPELATLPEPVKAALGGGIASMIASQWIQSGLLVCVHRYLAELAAEHLGVREERFWEGAARAVIDYQEAMDSELGDRYALFDFAAPAFVKLCLNRVRILGRGYDHDAERPVAAAVGVVENPLATAAERLFARAQAEGAA